MQDTGILLIKGKLLHVLLIQLHIKALIHRDTQQFIYMKQNITENEKEHYLGNRIHFNNYPCHRF